MSDPRELPELEVAKEADEENLLSQFRARQKRAVVFESAPLATDTEMAGALRLLLACSADTTDYDLWAQVLLVQADGSAVRLGEDIRRARFRNSPFHAQLLRPGELAQIPFEFNWAAWRLPAGAHLRVVIAPLNSPKYQKNYNTGGRIGYERVEDALIAHIRLLHDAQHASRLIVPLAAASARP